jgi:hypothetical protein
VTGVDDAYRRYLYLTDALGRLQRASLAKPLSEDNLRLGLIESGDTPRGAQSKIEQRIAQTRQRLSAFALLDICTAFESECRKRIPTAVGEAERVIRRHYNVPIMSLLRQHLVRRSEDFRSLEAIFQTVEQHLPGDGPERLRRLRKQRNRAAHGELASDGSDLSLEEVAETLNSVLDLMF